jgi:cytochrome b subunit of formate dehydrogenase
MGDKITKGQENLPENLEVRHKLVDRVFHWAMSLAVFILLLSSFLPIVGIRFDWLPWHWISGIFLIFLILFHMVRTLFIIGILNMVPKPDDFRELLFQKAKSSEPAKYNASQKFYHLATAISLLIACITGALMLAKIDTLFWNRDPSILSDSTWGIIYVLHGLSSLILIFLVIVHLYFTLIPEHREFLRSMLSDNGPNWARKRKDE